MIYLGQSNKPSDCLLAKTSQVIDIKDPPPLAKALVDEDNKEFGLTEREYRLHREDIDEAVREANTTYGFKPIKQKQEWKHLTEKDRAILLVWIRSKTRAANPEAKEKFRRLVDISKGQKEFL